MEQIPSRGSLPSPGYETEVAGPSTSYEAEEDKSSVGEWSVKIVNALSKLQQGQEISLSDISVLKEADDLIHRNIQIQEASRGSIHTPPFGYNISNMKGRPVALRKFNQGQFLASYSETGETIFRIFGEHRKFIVFKKVSEKPFFEQLTTDDTAAWSEVFFKNVNYGVQSNSCLGNIGHSKSKANVGIVIGCKEADGEKLKKITDEGNIINDMKTFSEFMEIVELHVIATCVIEPGDPLLMNYGYDPKKHKPNNVIPISEQTIKVINETLQRHKQEIKNADVPSYWETGVSEVSSESSEGSSSGSDTIIQAVASSDVSVATDPLPNLSVFKGQWNDFVTEHQGKNIHDFTLLPFIDGLSPEGRIIFESVAMYSAAGFDESSGVRNSAISDVSRCQPGMIVAESFLQDIRDTLYQLTNICFEPNIWQALLDYSKQQSKSLKRSAADDEDDGASPSSSGAKRSKTKD